MIKPKVYIRADGNSEIGLGHVIRSLALAEMLKDEFCCIFVTRFLTDYINTEACKACSGIILEWRNHIDVRKWAYSQDIIPIEKHISFIEGLKNNLI